MTIYIDRHGDGCIGRFCWVNSDTRYTLGSCSWTFWGGWWWDTSGEQRPAAQVGSATPEADND